MPCSCFCLGHALRLPTRSSSDGISEEGLLSRLPQRTDVVSRLLCLLRTGSLNTRQPTGIATSVSRVQLQAGGEQMLEDVSHNFKA